MADGIGSVSILLRDAIASAGWITSSIMSRVLVAESLPGVLGNWWTRICRDDEFQGIAGNEGVEVLTMEIMWSRKCSVIYEC